jgi:uncharacterized protein YecA (UPF0149 family)
MSLLNRVKSLLQNPEPSPPAAKPGRNEPCWCGSGKKYKKCHLPGEEAKAAAQKACSLNCGPT